MFKLSLRSLLRSLVPRPHPALYTQSRMIYKFSTTENGKNQNTNEASETKNNEKTASNPENSKETKKPEETKAQNETKSEGDASKSTESTEKKEETPEKPGFRERLKTSSPTISKCLEFGIYAWDLTFPKEKYHNKFEEVKKKAREAKKQEVLEFTDEDLTKMQDQIPEWKRTALILKQEQAEKESLKDQLAGKFKNKFNDTSFAKNIYKSDSYKEFQSFKKEMGQFKEDFKDHIENSPNPVVQTTLGIYSKVSNESTVARAIKEMRKIDPTFDLYELEEDAKGIFEAAYTTYLQGNISLLEKMCGEMALGYFKVLLRKMEAEKCEPKYKYLWQIDPAFFSTALIPEKRLPVFVFTIKTQEIYCNISKIDKRIVDGDDERLMNWEYQFAITPHTSPDLENVGHAWEIIELQPRQVLKMLV